MLLIAFGTRPEWIKLKPIIKKIHNKIPYRLLHICQHLDTIDKNLLKYDYKKIQISNNDNNNRLDSIVCSVMKQIDNYLSGITHVMVQGDTTTALAVALCSFHRKIRVIHLEAGLRTYDNQQPYPEEFNRQCISSISDIHLCATKQSAQNLHKENKSGRIEVVGNTVLDNLTKYKNIKNQNKNVLVTLHRRENLSDIKNWFKSIDTIAKSNSNLNWILPIHPNPEIKKYKNLIRNIQVVNSLSHEDLIKILINSKIIITDSGGIQEEASFFYKPCIVCRKETERKEGLDIFSWLCKKPSELKVLFNKLKNHNIDKNIKCPYGDGFSSDKIVKIIQKEIQ